MKSIVSRFVTAQRIVFGYCCLIILGLGLGWPWVAPAMAQLVSPLEKSGYQHLATSLERSEFLKKAAEYPNSRFDVELKILGKTTQNRSIDALLLKSRIPKESDRAETLRVMLMGGQHGSEISGCEALMVFAARLISTDAIAEKFSNITFLIIPAVNPDGIENKRRVNAQGINLSTDYGLLNAPESVAINQAMLEFKPHVVLDIHESALWKKQSLGAEGWLTDFEAQFEYANNPNVDPDLQSFTADIMLPEILKKVNAGGLEARHYIGEITQTRQTIQHGGLSAHNFRNKAGLSGAASFLVENRLDLSTGTYPTPRNIKERVRKQLFSIESFLAVCQVHAAKIIRLTEYARARNQKAPGQVWLEPVYGPIQNQTHIDIPLRRVNTLELVKHQFSYNGRILPGKASVPPKRYLFLSNIDFFSTWLTHQGIPFAACNNKEHEKCIAAEVNGPNGLLLPLFLNPVSSSSIIERLPPKVAHPRIVVE